MQANLAPLITIALALSGCARGEVPEIPTPYFEDRLYDDNHALKVSIEVDEEDWNKVRTTSRHALEVLGDTCELEPAVSPFFYVPAVVSIDGQRLAGVGLRKKGFFGSESSDKPSLKLKLDKYAPGQRLASVRRLTLNNNVSDSSQLRQCLGYLVTAAAGLPAPRCTLATVEVNGRPLGVYTHLEPIKKPFLRRHFDDDDGNLYAGTFSDFRPGWVNTFEKKTNASEADREDLDAVLAALALPDDEVLDALGEQIDLDRFYTFWALEVLLMHIDGYTRSTNNFYIYRDPATDLFVFFPWGVDVILTPDRPWFGEEVAPPSATWATSALARRLYGLAESRAAFAARLTLLLDEVWQEQRWLGELERLEDVLQPLLDETSDGERALIAASIDEVRTFIETRRETLETAVADLQPWNEPMWPSLCIPPIGEITVEIESENALLSLIVDDDVRVEEVPVEFSTSAGRTTLTLHDPPLVIEIDAGSLKLGPGGPAGGRIFNDKGSVAVFGHHWTRRGNGRRTLTATLYAGF